MDETKTVSRLWDEFKKQKTRSDEVTFDWFVLSLGLLFVLGAIEFDRGRVSRAEKNVPEARP